MIVRGDSGFCRWKIMRWCENHRVDYVLGIGRNAVLARCIAPLMAEAEAAFEPTGEKQRHFGETAYQAKTWDCPRRVIMVEPVGVRALMMFYNPVDGWRRVGCRDSRTRADWAEEVRRLLENDYPDAKLITLVCDNFNTHDVASLYHTFDAETAGRLRRRLRLVHTPKNGSGSPFEENTAAEIELSILSRQCLGQRFATAAVLEAAVNAWETGRNHLRAGTNWRFTTPDARIKLKSFDPLPDADR